MNRTRIVKSRIEPLPSSRRLDEYCAKRFTYLSLEQWREEISAGTVSLNGLVASDSAAVISGGELLAWNGSPTAEPEIDDRITVLFEDDWFVAVNKTGNLPVHPGGRYFNNTLVRLWEERCGRKLYPVHRLDRETSGIVVSAFDGRTAGRLSAALAAGAKEYLALVHGSFPEEEMTVDLPLGCAESTVAKKHRAWPGGGEKAVTRFRNVCAAGDISLVRCFPETGRMHQLRAHLLAAGFPIVGDKLYGRDENTFLEFIKNGLTAELKDRLVLPRQALHASRLVFTHPFTQKETIIHSPLPKMFTELLREKENRRLIPHAPK